MFPFIKKWPLSPHVHIWTNKQINSFSVLSRHDPGLDFRLCMQGLSYRHSHLGNISYLVISNRLDVPFFRFVWCFFVFPTKQVHRKGYIHTGLPNACIIKALRLKIRSINGVTLDPITRPGSGALNTYCWWFLTRKEWLCYASMIY